MAETPMTCEMVDQDELDRRYLEGRLSEEDAAAFEAHYFGCDRCWDLVKGGAGVRAALERGETVTAVRKRAWWKPLAIAAGIASVAFGTWLAVVPPDPAGFDAVRGAGDSLAVRSQLSAGVWHNAWPAVSEATSYRVRIFAADGGLLFDRRMTDTSLDVSRDSLPAAAGRELYLDVQAFDALRRPVARSPLIPLSAPADRP